MLRLTITSIIAVAVMASSLMASDILATVNGKNITKQDAEAFVSASSPNAHYSQLEQAQKDMIRDRLIEKVLITELAQKEGLDKNPEYIENLAKIKDELLVSIWMKTQMENVVVSDSEAKEFYDKNEDKFKQKATVHARHILVKEEKDAEEVINALKNLKDNELEVKFIELAKEKSTGPSGPKGGDLGSFAKGQMVPEFSEAVWDLKVGEITQKAVKTQFGYHIIYLEGKNDATTVEYDKVKDRIIASLKQNQFTAKVADIAKELKSKAKIVDFTKETNASRK